MKSITLVVIVALGLALTSCEAEMPSATPSAMATPIPALTSGPTPTPPPTATSTPTAAPLPTPTLTPSPTSTPISITPNALSVLRSAAERFSIESSFHVAVTLEDSDGSITTEIDVLRPDRIRLLMGFPPGGELISVGASRFILYPGFQGWLSSGETSVDDITDLGIFPYDLGGLPDVVQDLAFSGEEVLEGESTYRLAGFVPAESREEITLPPGADSPELDLWVGRDDLLPRRLEVSGEDPPTDLAVVYSGYGAQKEIRVPDDAIDSDYFDRLTNGELSPGEIGQLVRIFPVPGQQCIEEAIGTELYRMVIGDEIGNNILVWNAFRVCVHRIFPFSFERSNASEEP